MRLLAIFLILSSVSAEATSRFSITNLRNGLQFEVTGETLPPRQPEWGPPGGVKPQTECDSWELANGESAGFNLVTNPARLLWRYPDSMRVVETNIDAELAAATEKSRLFQDAIDRIAAYDEDEATASQRKQYLRDVQRVLKRQFGKD
jgi:hypothetical protein